MLGDRGNQGAQFGAVDDLLMLVAERAQFRRAAAQGFKFRFVLRHLDLAVMFEAAIVVHQVLDAIPEFERRHR